MKSTPQQAADEFNAKHPVGTWILYREIKGEEPGKLYKTRTRAQVLQGHSAVVWLQGKSGCVQCDHCEADPVANMRAAKEAPSVGDELGTVLNELAKGGPPTGFIAASTFKADGNLIYSLKPTTRLNHGPFENEVAVNVVAHDIEAQHREEIVAFLVDALNREFAPAAASPEDERTHLLVNVPACRRAGAPLVAFWREYRSGYTTSLDDAARYPRDFALKVEAQSEETLAIPLADIGHRLIQTGDVVPFTGDNAAIISHLLQVSNLRGKAPHA